MSDLWLGLTLLTIGFGLLLFLKWARYKRYHAPNRPDGKSFPERDYL